MFKNKKIVAMVLCALMLFVPVAAMAVDEVNFFEKYKTATAAADLSKLTEAETAYENALMAVFELGVDGDVQAAEKDIKEADAEYAKELKAAKKVIAELEDLKKKVEKYDGQITDKEAFKKANAELAAAKATLDKVVEDHAGQASIYDAAKLLMSQLLAAQKEGKSLEAAEKIFDAYATAYKNLEDNEKQQAAFAPTVVKAWDNFVKYASELQKDSKYSMLDESVQKLIDKGNTKYEVMSTGEKGWILSDEAKNGCLKDVAEFKVEKKDGKFVAKVYGADGKEMKIGQQLTVYRPIGKDVKVLKAKVDGKEVTFAISTRGEQTYVSVPVIY